MLCSFVCHGSYWTLSQIFNSKVYLSCWKFRNQTELTRSTAQKHALQCQSQPFHYLWKTTSSNQWPDTVVQVGFLSKLLMIAYLKCSTMKVTNKLQNKKYLWNKEHVYWPISSFTITCTIILRLYCSYQQNEISVAQVL